MHTQSCSIALHLKSAFLAGEASKYGRMFPELPGLPIDEAILLALGRAGSFVDQEEMAAIGVNGNAKSTDNPRIPAGFPIFGQFVAHDITADRSLLAHHARLNELRNFRTPCLDLESLYANGPTGSPYLYQMQDPDKFLLGENERGEAKDLPRNREGMALSGDPRDDIYCIISQLHLAFLKFHNRIVDTLRDQGGPELDVFSNAQRQVRWHYQWIVVHEYLPLLVGEELMSDMLTNGLKFYRYNDQPQIPVEFADAAYRCGHSQLRSSYTLNSGGARGPVFPDFAGRHKVPGEFAVDWAYFFNLDPQRPPQPSKRITPLFAHWLINLPTFIVGETEIPEEHSLIYRDLMRGAALNLPSGEAVATAMGVKPLSRAEVGLQSVGWSGETPLWFYILREAEIREQGLKLGEVGGRIVAEVLIGLLDGDPYSYRNAPDRWQPELAGAHIGNFTMADLLRYAGA